LEGDERSETGSIGGGGVMLEPAGTATLLVADATSRRRWKSVRRERMIRR
jgi:hypothetical protein